MALNPPKRMHWIHRRYDRKNANNGWPFFVLRAANGNVIESVKKNALIATSRTWPLVEGRLDLADMNADEISSTNLAVTEKSGKKVFMHMRYIAVSIILCLGLLLLACSSKPTEQTAQVQPAAPQQTAQPEQPATQPAPETAKPEPIAKPAAGKPHTRPAAHVAPYVAPVEPASLKTVEAKPMEQPLVVPAGTALTVRLAKQLSSKTSNAGDSFTATVAQAVAIDGKTLIPEGTAVSGKVSAAVPQGRFTGEAVLHLALDSITLNGHEQPIQTSSFTEAAKSKGMRTAEMIGGGTGVGALIGGLAGGGKGAALGAIAGAGAGTAGAGLTGNKDIVLPAEAALSFKLEQALEIKP